MFKKLNAKILYFFREKTPKKQIVIGSTYNYGLNHFNKLKTQGYLNNKDIPMFTVCKNGEIYKHFNILYHSNYLDTELSNQVISIAIEGLTYLKENNGKYFDIYNNEYNGEVYVKNWRGLSTWFKYTNEQFDSTVKLCNYLIEEAGIDRNVQSSNVTRNDISDFSGITYRSNHHTKYLDLNPSWDFKKFKKIIENEE